MRFGSFFPTSELPLDGALVGVSGRITLVKDSVDCYRNLNKPHSFSIKQRQGCFKGLVSGYARAVVIADPQFIVGEKARQRILRERVKNVHSYVRGTFITAFDSDLLPEALPAFQRVSYSPYLCGSFFELERDSNGFVIQSSIKPLAPAQQFSFAILNGSDVFLMKHSGT